MTRPSSTNNNGSNLQPSTNNNQRNVKKKFLIKIMSNNKILCKKMSVFHMKNQIKQIMEQLGVVKKVLKNKYIIMLSVVFL